MKIYPSAEIDPRTITIQREQRQRQAPMELTDLKASIGQWGMLNPIIVTVEGLLVAGERRLMCAIELGLATVPVRFLEDLSPVEAQIIELEENLKRRDLDWRDECKAVGRLHGLYLEQDPDWTAVATAGVLSMSKSYLSMVLRVHRSIDDPRIASVGGVMTAYNLLSRVDGRALADALGDIAEIGQGMITAAGTTTADPSVAPGGVTAHGQTPLSGIGIPDNPSARPTATPAPFRGGPIPADHSILNVSFLEWAPAYRGKPFNFIHCDFPYGINVFAGEQSGKNEWETYRDTPEIYWALCKCLTANLDRLMSASAHLVFWFSMEHYQETLAFFHKNAPSLVFQTFPLVWVKSDNVGLLPDPKRGPRRVYETALVASREDRLIVKPVANAHSSPTDKAHHHSTKPEPMLRQFFQMFVDENTRMLDPTCGSGSSLRAAESLSAPHVLGLELSEEHCNSARSALRSFRILRQATHVSKEPL